MLPSRSEALAASSALPEPPVWPAAMWDYRLPLQVRCAGELAKRRGVFGAIYSHSVYWVLAYLGTADSHR